MGIKIGYTTIMHEPRINFGLSMNDYAVCSIIYHLSNNPKAPVPGWCIASREQIGKFLGLSRRTVCNVVDNMVEMGLVAIQEPTRFTQTTDEWYDNFECFNPQITDMQNVQGMQNLHRGDADIAQGGYAKSAHNNNNLNNNIILNNSKSKLFLKIFNTVTGKNCRVLDKNTTARINTIFEEHTEAEVETVIKNAFKNEYHQSTQHTYLTPEFICRPVKFDQYLNVKHGTPQQNNSTNTKAPRTSDSGGKKDNFD